MFQQMIASSLAVLTRPSTPTFEEHKRDSLAWASIYVVVAAVLAAVLSALGSVARSSYIEAQIQQVTEQFNRMDSTGRYYGEFRDTVVNILELASNPIWNAFISFTTTLLGFFIALFIIFLIGIALSGDKRLSRLAYSLALFNAPLSVISAAITLAAIGPLSLLTNLIGMGIWIYSLVLTYFGVRASMSLAHGKALFIALLPPILIILLIVGSCALIVFAAMGLANSGG